MTYLQFLAICILLPIGLLAWLMRRHLTCYYLHRLGLLILQLTFGLDILWCERRWVIWAIGVPTLYLSLADALTIGAGIWTINLALSLPLSLGGILPVEEGIFFLLTNTLIMFGLVLLLTGETQHRAQALFRTLSHNLCL